MSVHPTRDTVATQAARTERNGGLRVQPQPLVYLARTQDHDFVSTTFNAPVFAALPKMSYASMNWSSEK